MADNFSIQVTGLESILPKIRSLPDKCIHQVLDDAEGYSLDVIRKEQPPYKYVSRKAAYGRSFFSDKQRRYFFAALKDGRIDTPYRRTGTLRGSWSASRQGFTTISQLQFTDSLAHCCHHHRPEFA